MNTSLQASAKQSAISNRAFAEQVRGKYGSFFDLYRGPIPASLCIAHTANVNSSLEDSPLPNLEYRRGFCKAGTVVADQAGIALSSLDIPRIAAYSWCKEVNQESAYLYTTNTTLFKTFEEDFWRTLYLKHRLGSFAFNQIWSKTTPVTGSLYSSLLNTVSTLNSNLVPWTAQQLQYLVFFDCEYVYWLGMQLGRFISTTYSAAPSMSQVDAMNNRVGGQ